MTIPDGPSALSTAPPSTTPNTAAVALYNPFTGAVITPGVDDAVPQAALLGLEPPRYCTECGRRMVVQISPDGWWAKCSRHGVSDSRQGGHR
ncbi:hypothetical protein SAMN05444695_102136 [Rhodococcus triatomae]|uniref:Biotin synthase auxiliary protein n=1 Tax=Rhodococcus triatomae TaxID=300028 RepID=A0A1G8CWR1_9NOCA|nr:hypothetical protein [Rhodococcus triatomae]SDH49862.1 hypothetical protein SAMN05444695_102136 [Rhodococcus triatomae]